MPKVEDDKLAKQYLLGELSEQGGAKVEEEYFDDDEAFERLSASEDELIDAYTLGQLSSAERKRFEQRLLLSSAQRERVKFSRTLLSSVSRTAQIESNIPPLKRTASWWTAPFTFLQTLNPAVSLSAAAVLIIAVLAGWWLIHRNNVAQEKQAQQTNAPSLKQENQAATGNARPASKPPSPTNQPNQKKPKEQTAPAPQSNRIVTCALVEGLTRDVSESNRLVIPEDAGLVRLHLTIERNEYGRYRAEVRKAEGGLVRQVSGILPKTTAPGKAMVALEVPAHSLMNGDYILTLSGKASGHIEVVSEYSFRVVRN